MLTAAAINAPASEPMTAPALSFFQLINESRREDEESANDEIREFADAARA